MTRRYTRPEFEQVFNHMFGELLPGATPQGIHELSTTKKYKIGSRLQLGNKVYHYAHVGVGATGLGALWGCKPRNQQELGFNAIPAAGAVAAGSWTLLIAIAAADGPAQNGTFPEDYLQGGTIIVRTAVSNFCCGIAGHPAKTAAGVGTLLLTLETPTPLDVAATNQQEGIASSYADVVHGNDPAADQSWQPIVGFPTMDVPAGNYVWIQTWGPLAPVTEGGVGGPGGAIKNLSVYSFDDGALRVFGTDTGINQYIGYVMAVGSIGPAGQGAPFVFIQLDP